MGYVRRPSGEVTLDPDEQAQGTIRWRLTCSSGSGTVGKVMVLFGRARHPNAGAQQ